MQTLQGRENYALKLRLKIRLFPRRQSSGSRTEERGRWSSLEPSSLTTKPRTRRWRLFELPTINFNKETVNLRKSWRRRSSS